MLQGSDRHCSPPGAPGGDRTDTTRTLQQARALLYGGSRELSRWDWEMLAAYVASHDSNPVECHRLLARSLAASPVASQALARFPTQMAALCIEALRSGTAAVNELIQQNGRGCRVNAAGQRYWSLRVFVLGRFRLLKDGAPIRFSRRAQRRPLELLQALIAFGGTEVSAGRLIDALWPDSEGDAGYHALESTLYRLRQLLGSPSAVAMAGGKLTLDRRQIWVDMWAFEGELRMGARQADAAKRLARMRELYCGDFLAEEVEKSWAVETRQIQRDRFVRAVRDIARSCESRGLWQEAIGAYQLGLEVDSLAEDLHRGLMTCHWELGAHGAAVQAYSRCRELLVRTLGVQPSAKTLALYQSVRHEAMSGAG